MANSPTSYLQTLAKDDAIAFVASLQSVKAHLHQELQWMETQVQQKTVQLQGMETLLVEASALGLVTTDTSVSEDASLVAVPSAPIATTTVAARESALESPVTAADRTLPTATEPQAAASAAGPIKALPKQPRTQKGKAASTKTPGGSKAAASTQNSVAKATTPKLSTPPKGKARQPGKASPLQPFLKSQWRDKALTESVANILNGAAAPLSTDEVMAALYDGLPKDNYDRAKHSLANILSVGRSKGTWKSAGRGLYAGNAGSHT